LLLSLTAEGGGGPVPHAPQTAAALQIVNFGPADVGGDPGTDPAAGTPGDASTGASSLDPTSQVDEFTPVADSQGLAAPDNSATYHIPEGATSFLVTLRILSPQSQADWSLSVGDGSHRAIGTVTVPRGQGGVTFAVVSPASLQTGSITLTIAANHAHGGQTAGAYVLEVDAAIPSSPDPQVASTDEMSYFFIGASMSGQNANAMLDEESPSRPHTSPAQGNPAAGAGSPSSAPPSGPTEAVYPKSTYGGGGIRKATTGEPTAEELAEAAESDPDSERTGQDGALALGDFPESLELAPFARQQVDAPGGPPGTDVVAGPRRAMARRMAEEGRLSHPGNMSGQVVISALVAAGLIVPNVLILGAPRFRPSRFPWRWTRRKRPANAPLDAEPA
jgi:hypothetical protein